MKIFAISDLHLAGAVDKPMDVFGPRWSDHVARIEMNWKEVVGEDDTVLIGGDISWASTLDEAEGDLRWIHELPGVKILLRGNHDYWWSTIRKIEDFCQDHDFSTLDFLRNDAQSLAGFHLCGTRGWLLESDDNFSKADEKILRREAIRLGLSLHALRKLQKQEGKKPLIALTHYPPIDEKGRGSVISDLLEEAGVDLCLFGHIHHHVPFYDSRPLLNGVRYIMVASDQINFTPQLIGEDGHFASAVKGKVEHG